MSHRLLPAFLTMLLVASPVMAQENFSLNWDENVKFRNYQTYIWAPRVTQKAAASADYALAKASIDRYLASRGFGQAANGNFAIGFTLGGLGQRDYEGSYEKGASYLGSLSIDVYDTASKRPIWHAEMSANFHGHPTQQQLDRAVRAMLNRFPPYHGCSHNPAHTLIHACPREE